MEGEDYGERGKRLLILPCKCCPEMDKQEAGGIKFWGGTTNYLLRASEYQSQKMAEESHHAYNEKVYLSMGLRARKSSLLRS